jgi:multidrug efflux system membrane fusion protein
VQRGPNGLFAFVVKADDTVAVQSLRVGQIQDGKAIIDEGLTAGTRVVVDGQYKLRVGAKVTEVEASAKSPKSAKGAARPEPTGRKPTSQ